MNVKVLQMIIEANPQLRGLYPIVDGETMEFPHLGPDAHWFGLEDGEIIGPGGVKLTPAEFVQRLVDALHNNQSLGFKRQDDNFWREHRFNDALRTLPVTWKKKGRYE